MPKILATSGVAAFLFTDIEGSSLKWLNHRSGMQVALSAHDDIMRKAIADQHGEVFKTAGDAFYAVFERPAEAVNAAISAQQAIATHDWSGVGGLTVRMAAHFGTAEWRDNDYFGPALNRCARLLVLGHGGQILITSALAELVASEREVKAETRALGSRPLDDPMQPVLVHQIIANGLQQEFPPLRNTAARATNLPQKLSRLIGREAELTKLCELISENRLVTLTGSGGVGKTRLAIAAGTEQFGNFASGAWLTEFAPIRDPSLVSSTVATAMGIGLDHNERASPFGSGVWLAELASLNDPALVASSIATSLGIELSDDRSPVDILASRLKNQQLLLILDNCEHVIEAVSRLSEKLLADCPGVRIVATSQEPLGIEGETVLRLQTLDVPSVLSPTAAEAIEFAAVALFVERAKTAEARFAISDENAPVIAAICRRLDGIALAIEMAAARVPVLGVTVLAQKLDQRFRLLTTGRRTALPRHQTLRATLDWSHDLLEMRERVVFRRLSVFAGGFTMTTAASVAGDDIFDEIDCVDAITQLAQKSLVAADLVSDQPRYRMMETTRVYALEKLAEAHEEPTILRRHAQTMRDILNDSIADTLSLSDAQLRKNLGPELENTRAALDWAFGSGGDPPIGVALAGVAEPMFSALALLSEARLRLDAASQRITSETPQEDVVRIWEGLGRVWGFSDPARAFEAYSRALPIRRAQGDETLLALLLVMMGRIAQVIAGRADESNALIDEAEPLIMRSDLARLKGQLFRGKANAAANVGDFSRSIASMCRACDAFRDAGADAADTAETSLAYMMWASGDIEGAIALCHRVIERIRREQFPNGPNLGFALGNLAGLLTERGDVEAAQVIFSQAVPLLCDPWQLWVIFDHVALCRAKAARYEDAALSMGFAEAAYISHRASRQINESRAHEATRTILRARLDPREMELLMSAGARLDERAAAQLAASF